MIEVIREAQHQGTSIARDLVPDGFMRPSDSFCPDTTAPTSTSSTAQGEASVTVTEIAPVLGNASQFAATVRSASGERA